MIKYIPFLKFKQNEIQSVAELDKEVRDQIVPLYDVPRSQKNMSEEDVSDRIRIAKKELEKSRKKVGDYFFFIDNFDIDDSVDLAGVSQYRAILQELADYPIIPVVAFDRSPDHNIAAIDFVKGKPSPGDIAIRLQLTDIESYSLTKINLATIWSQLESANPKHIILLLDLRIIDDAAEIQRKVERFLNGFNRDFTASVTAVTGSIIPATITNLISTNATKHVPREEYRLWQAIQSTPGLSHVLYGDYGVVSPEYSDADLKPELIGGRSAPKVFYTYDGNFFVVRGRRFRTHGYRQYFDISELIVSQPFFRGAHYSYGERYIHERSHLSAKRPAKAGSPSTWIKSLTAAHVTFVVKTI